MANRPPFFRALYRRFGATTAVVAVLAIVPADIAQADVAGKMDSYFKETGAASNVTGPTAYEGQAAGYYSGGNVWARFPQKSVTPFNIQLPSARAGCGGIDLFAGSFSFINASEMIALMKGVANNALGFAFKLAIDSVSPEIGKVMGEFSQAAQQMNQMNISSCEAAQGLVGGLWPKMQGARSTICTSVGNSQGVFSDWARSRQGCNAEDKQDDILAGNKDERMADHIPGARRNYTWQALRRGGRFGAFDKEFSEYLMTLVGTIILNTGKGGDNSIRYVGPAEDAVVTALLDGTQDGNKVKILKCDEEVECLNVVESDLTIPTKMGLRNRVFAMINSMHEKIMSDTKLNDDEKQLLNMSPLPLYKMLAVQSMAQQTFSAQDVSVMAEIVSVSLLSAMIDNMLDRLGQSQLSFEPADQPTAATWRQQLSEAKAKYAKREYRIRDTVQVTATLIDRTMMVESTLQNSMSPGMAAVIGFSRGLPLAKQR